MLVRLPQITAYTDASVVFDGQKVPRSPIKITYAAFLSEASFASVKSFTDADLEGLSQSHAIYLGEKAAILLALHLASWLDVDARVQVYSDSMGAVLGINQLLPQSFSSRKRRRTEYPEVSPFIRNIWSARNTLEYATISWCPRSSNRIKIAD